MTPAEQLAAAEANLVAHRARADVLGSILTTIRKKIAYLQAEEKAIEKERSALGMGWNKYGHIQHAEGKVEDAKRAVADESALRVTVADHYGATEWVLVSATPVQVKARRAGEAHSILFRLGRNGWTSYSGRLVNYDHEAALRWHVAKKKGAAK